MAKLVFDKDGDRLYETGVKEGVLFVKDGEGWAEGVVWNGLTAVTESPSGAESTALYADDIKYLNLLSAEEFGATIEAYSSPEEFDECDGTLSVAPGVTIGQQTRKPFCFAYKTVLGNDDEGNDHGFKLHFIFNAKAAPSERSYATVNDSPEAITLSWELSTTPMAVADGVKPVANVTLNSVEMLKGDEAGATHKKAFGMIMAAIYGCDAFVASKTYRLGDVVLQADKVYVCNVDNFQGAFDAASFVECGDATGIGNSHILTPDKLYEIASTITD